MPKLDKVSLLT
jgi:hypothetical protein